ncbi:Protein kinase [Cedratvirus A11]|uniref:Protein kinase n=1 Tax=Cedratvirus A11 TaxID=1903266 RepID=A0A1M7XU59_9VIRU|nr:Protein kinase [Cedratvirus A11]SHO33224.1 Protein kinase [Cedratvirus A11]
MDFMEANAGLGVTLQEVSESVKQNAQRYRQGFGPVDQTGQELAILQRIDETRPPEADFLSHLNDNVVELLAGMVDREFYNENVLYFMSDVLYAVYYSNPYKKELMLAKIKTWLTHLEQLSAGANGITLTAALGNLLRNDIVVKYPKVDDLTHEVFVGLLGTNNLRKYIPNFSFIYGGFACSPPIIGSDDEVKDFCVSLRPGRPLNYALYENVTPAVSANDLIKRMSGEEFLNFYLQLVLALAVAHEQIRFTHFDLHDKNVLARELTRPVNILYPVRGKEYHIKTSYIATIIDYGFSSFEYQGMHFGNLGSLVSYIGNVKDFPLYDAFKFLASAFITAANARNSSALAAIREIFVYFTPESPERFAEVDSHWFHALPPRVADVDLSHLIEYLVSLQPSALDVRGQSISCLEIDCSDKREVLEQVNFSSVKVPDSVTQLYINSRLLENPEKFDEYMDKISPELLLSFFNAFEQDLTNFDYRLREGLRKADDDDILQNMALYLQVADQAFIFRELSSIFPYIPQSRLAQAEEFLAFALNKLKQQSKALGSRLSRRGASDPEVRDKLSYIAYFQTLE